MSGCGGGGSSTPPPVVLQSIVVTPAAQSLANPGTLQFTATGSYSDGTTKNLTSSATWSSSAPAATISVGGLATSASTGPTMIKASSGGITGSTTLTVLAPVLTSIVISPSIVSIAATTTTAFTATGNYADGSTKNITANVTWNSSNTAAATINNTVPQGIAKGLAAGTTTITATSGTITSNSATLTVTSATLVSIAVTPASMSIPLGVLQQFTATGTFFDGVNTTTQDITNTVTWTSSGNSIASITVSGLATGLNLGTVTVTATSGLISGNTSLTVNAANLLSLAVTPATQSIAQSTTQQFAAIGTFNDGSTSNLTGQVAWSSSTTAVATIGSGNGLAKGLTPGMSTITATLGPKSATAALTVTNATVSSITVTPSGRTIAPGSKLAMTATAQFSDTTTQVISSSATWASDNTSFATVNTVGTATGVAHGAGNVTANISASLGGKTGSAPLIVSGATLASLAVTPSNTVLTPASTQPYQAVGTYSDGTAQNISNVVTWSSSAPLAASISTAGLATGQSAGTATITATIGAISNTAGIVVASSALQSIAVTPAAMSIPAQVAFQFTAIATFADGSTQDLTNSVTWTSSHPAFATISNSIGNAGLALGVSPGTSTITAAFGGVVSLPAATLTVNTAALQTIVVTPSGANIAVGSSQQFTATGNFSNGTSFNLTSQVTWTSSDVSKVVINSSGLANTAAVGTVTITGALGSTSGMTTLTVH